MKFFGFDFVFGAPHQLITVEDYRKAASRRLPNFAWAYVDGGAEDLATLQANRAGFADWSLRARTLTAKGKPDLSTTAVGHKLDLPVMLAPIGFGGLVSWQTEIVAVKAAEKAGTRYALGSAAAWSIEEVASAATQDHIFQLYPREGELAAKLMRRAWEAGFRTLFLTVDMPIQGNREQEKRTGLNVPPVLTPGKIAHLARYPRWSLDVLRHRRLSSRSLVDGGSLAGVVESLQIARNLVQSRLGWDDFAWVRDQWKGRVYLKGILDPEDAARAVGLGTDGIVVSNHGGRQLDFSRASIRALPDVVAAVDGRAEVLLDGGVRRGTDVIKALALGAKAVLIGRPYLYGIAADGQRGADAILEIFRSEMERALMLMGVGSISELDHSWLIREAS